LLSTPYCSVILSRASRRGTDLNASPATRSTAFKGMLWIPDQVRDDVWERLPFGEATIAGYLGSPCDERTKTYTMSSPLPGGEESEVRGFEPTHEGVFPSSCLPWTSIQGPSLSTAVEKELNTKGRACIPVGLCASTPQSLHNGFPLQESSWGSFSVPCISKSS
jgi:hypothetical protein